MPNTLGVYPFSSLSFPAMSLFACALYAYTGMWSLGKSPPHWLSQLPVAIIGLAVLLGTLQPELGWEVCGDVHVGVEV